MTKQTKSPKKRRPHRRFLAVRKGGEVLGAIAAVAALASTGESKSIDQRHIPLAEVPADSLPPPAGVLAVKASASQAIEDAEQSPATGADGGGVLFDASNAEPTAPIVLAAISGSGDISDAGSNRTDESPDEGDETCDQQDLASAEAAPETCSPDNPDACEPTALGPLPLAGGLGGLGMGGLAAAAGTAAAAGAAAGSGSTSSADGSTAPTAPIVPSSTSGLVAGPTKGGLVFYDANGNGVRDSTEVAALTSADGSFVLPAHSAVAGGLVVYKGGTGVDTFTGQTIQFDLAVTESPAGSPTVISPLTFLTTVTGLTEAELKAALELPNGLDLKTFNAYDAMNSGTPSLQELGRIVFTAEHQIFTSMQAAANIDMALNGVTPAIALLDAAKAVATAIKTSDNLPAESQHGQGLIDAISAFVIADASGIDTTALQDRPSALDELNADLEASDKFTSKIALLAVQGVSLSTGHAFFDLPLELSGGNVSTAQAHAILGQTALMDAIGDAFGPAHDTNGLGGLLTPLGLRDAISDIQAVIPSQNGGDISNGDVPTPVATSVWFDQVHSAIDGGSSAFNLHDIVTENLTDAELAHVVGGSEATVNVDHLNMLDDTGEIRQGQAQALIGAGLDFVPFDDITLHVEGSQMSTTLNDLHNLGVDHVVTDPAQLGIGGHDVVIDLGFSSNPSAINPGADLLAFLQTFPAHTPFFENGAQAGTPDANVALVLDNATFDAMTAGTHEADIVSRLLDLGVDVVKIDIPDPDADSEFDLTSLPH